MWEDEGELLGSAVVRLKKKQKNPTVFVIFLFNFFGGEERHKLGSGSKHVLIGIS